MLRKRTKLDIFSNSRNLNSLASVLAARVTVRTLQPENEFGKNFGLNSDTIMASVRGMYTRHISYVARIVVREVVQGVAALLWMISDLAFLILDNG